MLLITTSRNPGIEIESISKKLSGKFGLAYVSRGGRPLSKIISDSRYGGWDSILLLGKEGAEKITVEVIKIDASLWKRESRKIVGKMDLEREVGKIAEKFCKRD